MTRDASSQIPHVVGRVDDLLVVAAYHRARNNPDAYGRGTEIDEELYAASRWIAEPYHVFDCSRENDAGAAVLVVAAERGERLR